MGKKQNKTYSFCFFILQDFYSWPMTSLIWQYDFSHHKFNAVLTTIEGKKLLYMLYFGLNECLMTIRVLYMSLVKELFTDYSGLICTVWENITKRASFVSYNNIDQWRLWLYKLCRPANIFWCLVCFIAVCYSLICGFLIRRSPLMLGVRITIRARSTKLCDKVCQWLATVRCFLRVLRFPPPIKLTAPK